MMGRRVSEPATADQPRKRFGLRGWVLVIALAISFVFIPAFMLVFPPQAVPFKFAYLALPVIPAVGLGIIAVWAALG